MDEISEQVEALLTARHERLPAVRAEIAKWHRVDAAVLTLAESVTDLRQHPATPPPVAAHLDRLRIAEARSTVTAAIEPLQQVERRIGRGRLCIGVGGAGGSGKTTVVQSLTGLTEEWLPTGGSGPVTAVRTRVVHSPGRLRAVLAPHTVETFRAAHPDPRHITAGLAGPAVDTGALSEIQAALWSYEGLLARQGRPLELVGDELDRLREYLTHPSDEDRPDPGPVPHRYLAVRDARIECVFPHADVGAIEIVDLPGLVGAAGTDRHHLAGLRHDVDLVLLVKRMAVDAAHWDAADDHALALLDEARGFVSRRDDFVLVVLNAHAQAAPSAGHDHATPPDRHGRRPGPRAVVVDGRSPADVSARLLRPMLRHLAERLPVMDAEVFAGTRTLTGAIRDQLIDLAVATKVVISQECDATGGTTADLYLRADELYAAIAAALRGVLARVRDRAGQDDPDLIAAAGRVHAEVMTWIRGGLGVGYDQWCAAARRGLLRGQAASGFARTELDRVRAEIDRRYEELDTLLRRRLLQTWEDVADAMGPLLGERSGAAALAHLDDLAAAAARPCPALRAAVGDLLAVRLDYRTHLCPRVRAELTSLAVDEPVTSADVAQLHRLIAGRAEQAAARVQARLLSEATLPGWILLTAVERFVDAVVGTEIAEREIRNLARSYRHALWPGLYVGLGQDDAAVTRITRAADELLAATAELDTDPPG